MRLLIFGCMVCGWFILPTDSLAQTKLTADDFYSLPAEQLKPVLKAGIKQRLNQLKNFKVTLESEKFNAKYANGVVGERTGFESKSEQELYRIGSSYQFLYRYREGSDPQLYESRTGYDSKTGKSTMFVDHRDFDSRHVRIDVKKDPITKENRFGFFLDGYVDEFRPSHYELLLERWEDVQVRAQPSSPGMIECQLSFEQDDDSKTERVTWFAPEKDFMITKIEHRWRRGDAYTNVDVLVEASQEFDGMWHPTKAFEAGWTQYANAGEATISTMSVVELSCGEVQESDLVVDIPLGSEVNDMTRAVTYVAGKEDEAIPYREDLEPVEKSPNSRLILLLGFVVCLVFGWVVVRRLLGT